MKILDDLIGTLRFDCAVRDIRQGVFHTGVLTRNCGLAATLPRDALRQEPPMVREPGFLLDKDPEALARMAYSGSILEAAIGMAAINSLLEINEDACIELNAAEVILEKGKGRKTRILSVLSPKTTGLTSQSRNERSGPLGTEFAECTVWREVPSTSIVAVNLAPLLLIPAPF